MVHRPRGLGWEWPRRVDRRAGGYLALGAFFFSVVSWWVRLLGSKSVVLEMGWGSRESGLGWRWSLYLRETYWFLLALGGKNNGGRWGAGQMEPDWEGTVMYMG